MGHSHIGLRDVAQHARPSRLRLLAPLRYLAIHHAEKDRYDLILPLGLALVAWVGYMWMTPKIALFGESGLLRFARDLLVMAVPFMVGALAAVSMGGPGPFLDRRPVGAELYLDGRVLTLRQFLCYLLGYLSFLGLMTLAAVVCASLMHDPVLQWIGKGTNLFHWVRAVGALILSVMLSMLSVTVLWSLYFMTDVANNAPTNS